MKNYQIRYKDPSEKPEDYDWQLVHYFDEGYAYVKKVSGEETKVYFYELWNINIEPKYWLSLLTCVQDHFAERITKEREEREERIRQYYIENPPKPIKELYIPMMTKVKFPELSINDIVGVQPMMAPIKE
jgi:hypothetical protein